MYFKQFYLGCLAHASYLIGSDGEAVVVDPQRDVDQYIEEANAQDLQIKYIIETHLHADFVSGHRELADKTGAEIVFGKEAGATFPHRAVKDGDELMIGRVKLRIMETPGHTPESICVLVTESEKKAGEDACVRKLLTGDTLFIGDVGRPDLAGGRGYTSQDMAAMMYDSLHKKILTLPDDVEVYPAHGAGSMCGKNLSTDTSSTIGHQRKFNYALQAMSKDEFVRLMTTDLPEAPAYFPKDAEINRGGAASLEGLPPLQSMTPVEVAECAKHGGIVLDVRTPDEFGSGHVPGSMNIGLGGQFASWAGTLIPMTAPIVLLAESQAKAEEARMRLARVGLENIKGHLAGGIDAWKVAGFEVAIVPQISVGDLKRLIESRTDLQVLDVRRPAEYESGHVPRAVTSPLSKLRESWPLLAFDPAKTTTVICAGGYRSSAATSLLQAAGFSDLLNVIGGTTAWIKAGYEVEGPTTVSKN
ncbi:MAG TPA: rhodanese-like domain-containing protein [Pyrinomonadaceae bacterium]|nr:rhodanese-like domain-containing protein [Pyrinomonadaceae bacterium]